MAAAAADAVALALWQRRNTELGAERQRESAELRRWLAAIPSPLFFKDKDGRLLGCNPAFEAFRGAPEHAMVSHPMEQLDRSPAAGCHRGADRELLIRPGVQQYEAAVRWADGTWRDALFAKGVIRGSDGAPEGIAGIMVDVTARKASERRLRESERRYREVAEATGGFVWEIDCRGDWTYLTDRVQAVLGHPVSALLGTPVAAHMEPKDAEVFERRLLDLKRLRAPFAGLEIRTRRKTGEAISLRLNGVPLIDHNERLAGFRGLAVDVTDIKGAAGDIDKAGTLVAGYWEYWPQQENGFASADVVRILDGSTVPDGDVGLADFVPDAFVAAAHPDDAGLVRTALFEATSDEDRLSFRIVRADGSVHRTVIDWRTERDADGQPIRQFGLFQEIGTGQPSDLDVGDSEAQLQLLAENATDMIALLGADGAFLYVSPSSERLLGHPPGDLIGRNVFELCSPEDLPALRCSLLGAVGGEDMITATYRIRHQDGTWIWFESTHSRVRENRHARGAAVVSVSRDIGERVRYEHELEDERGRIEEQASHLADAAEKLATARYEAEMARIAAEDANRAKSQFLATMSHELRTPLNAILGFSEIIKDCAFGPEAVDRYVEYAADVYASGQHLLDLINDILDISKIEAGKLEIEPEMLDLVHVLRSCVRLVAVRARDHGLTLSLDLPEHRLMLYADFRAIKQIVFNLLSNAIKYTADGGNVLLRAEGSESGAITISVADTGIGIPKDQIARVMEPFEQLDNRYNRSRGGTGLGLALVKALVYLHSGEIRIESDVGVGTTVSVIFPPESLGGEECSDPPDEAPVDLTVAEAVA